MNRGQSRRDRQERNSINEENLKEELWKKYYDQVKKNMSGTEEEKDIILRKRLLKYFQDYHLESDLFFIKRRDQDPSSIEISNISPTSLFLYGIDFLSVPRIKQYFQPYQVEVSIYDDSHCQVGFKNSMQLLEAFYSKLLQKPESVENLYNCFKHNNGEMIQWREILGYSEMTVERKMWARFITKYDYDEKKEVSSRASMQAYQAAKSQFLSRHEKNVPKQKKSQYSYNLSNMLHRKNHSDKEKNKKSCCCQEKMNKLIEILQCSCSHHNQRKNDRQERKRSHSYKAPQRERTRDKKKKYNFKKDLFKKDQVKNSSLIEELSKNQNTPTKSTNNLESLTQLSQIQGIKVKEQEHSQDDLIEAMIQEFSKYEPFKNMGNSKNSNNVNIDKSFSSVSYFQYQNDDDEEENK